MTKRKPNKYFFKRNADKSITFKSQQLLRRYMRQAVEEETEVYKNLLYQEVLDDVEQQTEIIARDVLKRKWGFGKKRQNDFLEAFNYQIDCIKSKHVSFEDINKLNKGEIE